MSEDQESAAQKARDFERATSLLPPDVYWGHPINSVMVLAIAEAATARQASELTEAQAYIANVESTAAAMASELEALRKDAGRYRWLKGGFSGADFDWNESAQTFLLFHVETGTTVWGCPDLTIDEAMAAAKDPQP